MSPKSVAEKLLIKPNTTVWSSQSAMRFRPTREGEAPFTGGR
jgi:hypothetical protein